MQTTPLRIFVGAIVAAVAVTVVAGLYLAGSPNTERLRQFDGQRLSHLQTIAAAVDAYYERNVKLPASLAELSAGPDFVSGKPGYFLDTTVDPATRAPYEYRTVSEDVYELCAAFDLTSEEIAAGDPSRVAYAPMPAAYPYTVSSDWTHPAGRHCYSLNAQVRTARVVCGLTNPCAAGQTCASLPGKQGAVCVPEGKECLAAGCAGQCVIAESYPVQVRCAGVPTP